ncbi:Zn-dependent hydrolase [Candidatus Aerophobetes bacterium]|uniref:Zn-dependent hydrolase n=1 Tax=Aerophobetes bacterium TaxID=2030807 RepID=A0A2A4YAX9_UNCAE|nr:MAG: Zn-dependent hydrolase [Candidatus Aerophobetes bacterium]
MRIFCPLASGSKGNSILFATPTTKILIDAGISFKQITERLQTLNISIHDIDAVVITHEHADHIRGLDVLSKKTNIPILANTETAKAILESVRVKPNFKIFSTGETFTYGDVDLHPFSIQHDTVDPVAFTLCYENLKFGVCADLGFVSSLVKMHLKDCDYLYIESNHEPSMVHACSRPYVYKQRVLGRQGHLSNQNCAELLKEISHTGLKHVYLAHLSDECNNPEVALKSSKTSLESFTSNLSIAYQHKVSEPVYF